MERIVARRGQGLKTQFLVKWADYPDSDNSWRYRQGLRGAGKAVRDFERREREGNAAATNVVHMVFSAVTLSSDQRHLLCAAVTTDRVTSPRMKKQCVALTPQNG